MSVQEAVRRSAEELQLRVETHRRLLAQALEGGDAGPGIDAGPLTDSPHGDCSHEDCPHRRRLRETLADVIAVLEATRKAFKSKQLETLRKRLIGVLAEDA